MSGDVCKHCNHELKKDKVSLGHWCSYAIGNGGFVSKKCRCGCMQPERKER